MYSYSLDKNVKHGIMQLSNHLGYGVSPLTTAISLNGNSYSRINNDANVLVVL